jgi:hypothetical protein
MFFGLGLSCGCVGGFSEFSDQRPPTTPQPVDVQQEIRDARYFLPLPDESVMPPTGFTPRLTNDYPSSL